MHIIIIGALPESLLNFRGDLIISLIKKGMKVTAIAEQNAGKVTARLIEMGAEFRPIPIQRNRLNPIADLKTLFAFRKSFQALKPDVIFAYTIKPIIWSGIASHAIPGVRFYAMITGLGFAFHGNSPIRKLLTSLVGSLYRTALKRAAKIIFQNSDDLNEFVSRNIVHSTKCALVNGSGVNTQRFTYAPLPSSNMTFLTIGRLLGEKGFREYAQAAKIVKAKYPDTTFQLIGPEVTSPDSIPMTEVQWWHQQGWLEYLGSTRDVRPYLQNCHVFVLPSYYGEGLPRTIIEAMATGRPILTTDNVGCRDTVIPGENGYLVQTANAQALALRMIWFIENRDQLLQMGKRSRELAEEKYDVNKVNVKLMEIMML